MCCFFLEFYAATVLRVAGDKYKSKEIQTCLMGAREHVALMTWAWGGTEEERWGPAFPSEMVLKSRKSNSKLVSHHSDSGWCETVLRIWVSGMAQVLPPPHPLANASHEACPDPPGTLTDRWWVQDSE